MLAQTCGCRPAAQLPPRQLPHRKPDPRPLIRCTPGSLILLLAEEQQWEPYFWRAASAGMAGTLHQRISRDSWSCGRGAAATAEAGIHGEPASQGNYNKGGQEEVETPPGPWRRWEVWSRVSEGPMGRGGAARGRRWHTLEKRGDRAGRAIRIN